MCYAFELFEPFAVATPYMLVIDVIDVMLRARH